jgi:hypothetical protein
MCRATEEHPDTQRQASDDQADPVVRSWAAGFAAEVEEGAGLRAPRQFEQQQASSEQMARQDSLVVSDSEEDELKEQAGVEETPRLASLPADDEEARLGLLKASEARGCISRVAQVNAATAWAQLYHSSPSHQKLPAWVVGPAGH